MSVKKSPDYIGKFRDRTNILIYTDRWGVYETPTYLYILEDDTIQPIFKVIFEMRIFKYVYVMYSPPYRRWFTSGYTYPYNYIKYEFLCWFTSGGFEYVDKNML